MTFEEFFLKKKIDLEHLAHSNLELFSEFKSHFEQMSEKSFDHTKKYWFNDLRKKFPLSEEKEITLKEAFKPKEISAAPITEEIKEISNTPKPKGFTPRFKAGIIKTEVENTKSEELIKEEKIEITPAKPTGFKPRFKAQNTNLKSEEAIDKEENKVEEIIAKPTGFKPRFKAGQTQVKKNSEK